MNSIPRSSNPPFHVCLVVTRRCSNLDVTSLARHLQLCSWGYATKAKEWCQNMGAVSATWRHKGGTFLMRWVFGYLLDLFVAFLLESWDSLLPWRLEQIKGGSRRIGKIETFFGRGRCWHQKNNTCWLILLKFFFLEPVDHVCSRLQSLKS